jgi:hypothetical protein
VTTKDAASKINAEHTSNIFLEAFVEQHVKILAWLNIVLGGLGVVIALFILVFFGGLAIAGTDNDPAAQGVLGAIGGFVFIIIAALSVPCVIAGIGLLKFRSWAQILTIIMSVLGIANFPFGTALGIYGLWVMLNKETKPLFRTA